MLQETDISQVKPLLTIAQRSGGNLAARVGHIYTETGCTELTDNRGVCVYGKDQIAPTMCNIALYQGREGKFPSLFRLSSLFGNGSWLAKYDLTDT